MHHEWPTFLLLGVCEVLADDEVEYGEEDSVDSHEHPHGQEGLWAAQQPVQPPANEPSCRLTCIW